MSYWIRDNWYCAIYSSDLEAGAVAARTVCGQRLVLWRGGDGVMSVLVDRSLPRDYALEDEGITHLLHAQVAQAFAEDKTMMEAQTRNIAAFDRFITGAIPADLALLHVRKLMAQRSAMAMGDAG